ncbi:MAG: DUF3798 domain-containing protein [Ezakiella sp.]|nr:DUF3798 domain-containing protein [Bacillota bacterium]MDY3947488.1 DUF3798 domain-containing protein [Ezakiella sp.]
MKKLISILLALAMTFSLVACSKKDDATSKDAPAKGDDAPFHIGVLTGTVSQSEDEQRGAESMIKKYGDVKDGGYVILKNYPDNFSAEQETTIQQIVSFADDPKMKAIIINQGVPGTSAAIKQVKEKRPDILCFVGNSQEDPNLVESVADLVIDPDNVTRGYLIPLAAQKMGANTFVHVSFPRHMSIELLSLRKDIMEATCDKIGMKFVMETAPDPTSDVGIPGAQNFILEQMPAWVEKYGKDTAFFATNDAHTEPMLLKVAELGAYFVEQDLPSPILGYTGALNLDLKEQAGDWPAILKKVEETVVEKGASGHMGLWAFSFGYSTTQALTELAKRCIEGKADFKSLDDIKTIFGEFTPGAEWGASWYIDNENRKERTNHALVLQDTYVLGSGYLGMTKEEIPDIYKMLDDFKAKQ